MVKGHSATFFRTNPQLIFLIFKLKYLYFDATDLKFVSSTYLSLLFPYLV